MKLACSMGGFRNFAFEDALAVVDELGFEHFEGTTDGRAHLYPYAVLAEDSTTLEKTLAAYRPRLISIAGGWSDFAVADEHLEKQYASVRNQLALCRRLGVRVLRLFASHLPSKYVDDAFRARVIRNVKRLAPDARAAGVTIAIENHYGITATSDDVLRLLEGVGDAAIRANFDGANFVPMGDDPLRACTRLLPYIAHVHCKDARYTGRGRHEGWEYCEIGAGVMNYGEILAMLNGAGYEGAVCVEYENPVDVVGGTVVSHRALRTLMNTLGRAR